MSSTETGCGEEIRMQRGAADFMCNKRLWLHHTVCDGSGTEVRAHCQYRCPEGRVDEH